MSEGSTQDEGPIAGMLCASRALCLRHAGALTGLEAAGAAVVWLPFPGARRDRRPVDRADSEIAMRAACRLALASALGANEAARMADRLRLGHTALGQPVAVWPGGEPAWLRRDLHVSFSHDGEARLAAAACAADLRGLGIDVVHLPRLAGRRWTAGYLRRLAARVMGEEELRRFLACAPPDGPMPDAARLFAAHFALKEAASKALGTGLRLGIGIGRPGSVSPREVSASPFADARILTLRGAAAARLATLGAKRAEGHWSADNEYLLSLVLLR
ncbi:MAG: 4'-phosphopantetheinyl transferase superfamily protein [Chthonomonadales bacterium]|nr:4'-phosphopantetheinyl transferase superfamily protein [Chthonomonadales bacterium]